VLCFVVGCEGCAGGHGDTESGEEVAADFVGAKLFGGLADADGGLAEGEGDVGDDVREDGAIFAQAVVEVDAVGVA